MTENLHEEKITAYSWFGIRRKKVDTPCQNKLCKRQVKRYQQHNLLITLHATLRFLFRVYPFYLLCDRIIIRCLSASFRFSSSWIKTFVLIFRDTISHMILFETSAWVWMQHEKLLGWVQL